jgi:hypothetical protein
VDGKAALDIVQDTEVLARLLQGNDILSAEIDVSRECLLFKARELTLETSGVGVVSANLPVNLDQTLGNNGSDLASSEGVLQAVA